MNTRSWKFSSVSVVAFSAALVLTGCGSGGGEESASPSSAASSSAASSSSATASTSASSTAGASPEVSEAPDGGASAEPTSPAAGAPDDSAAPAACGAADLAGTVEDMPGGGAAGSVYRSLVLTNISAAACTTSAGYPGVSYLNAAGDQLGAAAVRSDGSAAGSAFVLQPGQSASAELKETRAENYGADCVAEQATQLLVYPPEDLEALTIPHEVLACANPNVELLGVGPLQQM